jgi:hypothetical protein
VRNKVLFGSFEGNEVFFFELALGVYSVGEEFATKCCS